MTSVSILRQLPQLVRYADVEKFTGNANVFLTRAQAKGYVIRVARGVYINRLREPMPAIEEIACFLRTPSYISCEWALNRHGVLLQSPVVCTVLTLDASVGVSRNVHFGVVTIEFSRIAPRLFNGFETMDGFNLAGPEKALLDAIYLRKRVPFADELELDAVDKDKLLQMAGVFPDVVRKRLEDLMVVM
ncbi:MAG: type IV toxin-antitoxin system AbiEi family antitoxin domain-containing protein [Deltaproteobacteria bacterium]|nr:type IV toxin-antitoxin system AbiEi family antitoxin domain-containing protein [Deltaproteobacteria bacterium]